MRRPVLALSLATLLALSACTSDDATIDLPPSDVATPAPTATSTETATPAPTESGEPSGTPDPTQDPEPLEGADTADIVLVADLSGAAEVPGPGDDAGSGHFDGYVVLGENSGDLCYRLAYGGLSSEVTAAHIHLGEPGEAGGVVITLSLEGAGDPTAPPVCETLNASDLVGLLDDTDGHYVNVHTTDHPDGAVRGQLKQG